jgi:hypothetical protein
MPVSSSVNPYTIIVKENHEVVALFDMDSYTVTLLPNPADGGWVNPPTPITVLYGDDVTIEATPDLPYYTWINWTEATHGTVITNSPIHTFPVIGDTVLYANFLPTTHTVTVTAVPSGGGGVSGGGVIVHNKPTTLVADPAPCYHFLYWVINGNTIYTPTYVIDHVLEDLDCYAWFEQSPAVVIASASPAIGGWITQNGTTPVDTLDLLCGQTLTLTAMPNVGYRFVNWTKDGVFAGVNPVYTITPVEDTCHLVAYFEYVEYTILLQKLPPIGGQVGTTGVYPLSYDLTVHAIPNPCYRFVNWTEDGIVVSTDADYPFSVTSDRILTANFAWDTLTVSVSVNPLQYGWGTVEGGSDTTPCGEWIQVIAVPESCYEFDKWMSDNTVVSLKDTFDFPVNHSMHLVAYFKPKYYLIDLHPDPVTGGYVEGGGIYACGERVVIHAYPYPNFEFDRWTEDGVTKYILAHDTLTVDTAHTLVAHFTPKPCNITVTPSPQIGGTVALEGGGQNFPACPGIVTHIAAGELITLTAQAGTNYVFVKWTLNGDSVYNHPGYSFVVTGAADLVAHFAPATYTVNLWANTDLDGTVELLNGPSFPFATPATIQAYPYLPYHTFVGWYDEVGEPMSQDNPHSFFVYSDRLIEGRFTREECGITLTASPQPYGDILLNGVISAGGSFPCGAATITVEAVPVQTCQFLYWTDEEDPGFLLHDNPYTFPVLQPRHLVAHFDKKNYEIEVVALPPIAGTVLPVGVNTYSYGEILIATATDTNSHYTFHHWCIDEAPVSNSNPYSHFVTGSCTLVAHFISQPYTITLLADPTGTATFTGGGIIPYGLETTIVAIPDSCYDFVEWREADTLFTTSIDTTITVLNSRTFVAHLTPKLFNITVAANPTVGGTVTPDEFTDLPCGEPITAYAYPNTGYVLENWTFNGAPVSLAQTCTFTPKESGELIANFKYETYNVTLIAQPNGYGTVSGGGQNIPAGEKVAIEADPKFEYTFVNWTEEGVALPLKAHDSLTVDRDYILYANFRPSTLDVYVSADPINGGTVEVEGGGIDYTYGEFAHITATAAQGYTFIEWRLEEEHFSYEADYRFPVTQTFDLVAHFELTICNIVLLSDPPEGGTLEGDGTYAYGDDLTVKATANSDNFLFKEWREDGEMVAAVNPFSFTVKKSRTLVAYFEEKICTITMEANPPQGGNVFGGGSNINNGSLTTIAAKSNHNYKFVSWTNSATGELFATDSIYTFKVTRSMHLIANFMELFCNVTLVADPEEGGTLSGGGTAIPNGTIINLKATPTGDFTFINWTEGDEMLSYLDEYPFEVTHSCTLVAHFTPNLYNIKALANPATCGTVTGGGDYYYGDTASVYAQPEPGYAFASWTENNAVVSLNEQYSFIVTGDRILIAHFEVPGLDFDTYAATLWDNTFMLNLNRLEQEGYKIAGCKWFKNETELLVTNTIDQFSYSAGPKPTDRLDLAPTFYTFKLITKSGDTLYSTRKALNNYNFHFAPPKSPLLVYPNPAWAGTVFTVEGLTQDTPIEVYNQYGMLLHRTTATDAKQNLSLNLPSGIYFIRNNNKEGKITIIR